MNAPTVACVMLANGRPEMVARSVKSFRAQTYDKATLFIWDQSLYGKPSGSALDYSDYKTLHLHARTPGSIGWMRNAANEFAGHKYGNDIICHWDSDDWSHPNRIAEQVALLQSSGAECVGYNEMLFWDITPYPPLEQNSGAAWIYRAGGCKPLATNYAIGTSLCYWRKTWEQFPFPDYSPGCDDLYWCAGDDKKGRRAVKIEAVSAFQDDIGVLSEPRMIASIHGGNTCAKIDSTSKGGKEVWARVQVADGYCREAMNL